MTEPGASRSPFAVPPGRDADMSSRRVPDPGIVYRHEPSDGAAVVGTLPEGTRVSVIGRQGRWVRVATDDGVEGWVDGPALAGAPDPAVAAAPAPTRGRGPRRAPSVPVPRLALGLVLGMLAGAAVVVGAAMTWQHGVRGEGTLNAFDIPFRFVVDNTLGANEGSASLGLVLTCLAGLGIIGVLLEHAGILRRVVGLIVIGLVVLYVVQWQDLVVSQLGGGVGTGLNVWDVLGWGPVTTFLGGAVLLLGPQR